MRAILHSSMHRLLPLRAVPHCIRSSRSLHSVLHLSTWPRKLTRCTQPSNQHVCSRPLWTSSPLYREPRTNEEEEEEERAEDDKDEHDDDHEPPPYRPSSTDSTSLPLKYLLRSDFFSSLLLTHYPNLTPLQYRTHLSSFIRTNRHNLHVHHLVHQLVSGDEQEGREASRRKRKHSKRNRRVKLAREIAYIYAKFVRDETGEGRVTERQKVRGGRGKRAAAAEDGEEEREDEEDVVDGEGEWEEDAQWSAGENGGIGSGQSRANHSKARDEHIDEEDEDGHEQQRRQQQSPLGNSSFLRGRGGRLRYDPSLAFLADLSQPHQTYPLARSLNRKIILHTGPTNSGKTHAAMQALQSAHSGVYAAPLRLLAWEQYDRMTKRGVKAELITGQEEVMSDDATHTSSTIEMVSVEQVFDVAVIDEVQMIGSEDRGGAWTRALLGVAARTLHVCGDVSVIGLMEDLCSVTGEELQIVSYSRLTPLQLSPPLLSLSNLRRGDCIIAFARSELYGLKRSIESNTRLRCAIIYGNLPPALRRQQAELFNAVDGPYDVLVATDAVGMGLNLSIGRIIFSTLTKFDGREERLLTVRETLQIAGRAGRFAGVFDVGEVTTLTEDTYGQLRHLMGSELEPLTHAGLSVTLAQLEALALHRPESLHVLLRYLEQFAAMDDLYFLSDLSQWIAVAKLLHSFPSLSLRERYIFCLAPVSADKPYERATLLTFLHQYTTPSRSHPSLFTVSWRPLADWRRLSSLGFKASDVLRLEEAWKGLDIYVWLSRRLGEDRFTERAEAEEMRERVSEKIAVALSGMSQSELKRRRGGGRKVRLSASERKVEARERRRLMRVASVDWMDVDESGDEAEVREATVDVSDATVTPDTLER